MSERVLLALIVVVAVLGTVPAISEAVPYTGLALVVLGLVAGFTNAFIDDVQQRTAIYVLAVALPVAANSLDVIPVVGAWADLFLHGVAIGLQGMTVAIVLMQLKVRIMPEA